jgi:hypothetical protein
LGCTESSLSLSLSLTPPPPPLYSLPLSSLGTIFLPLSLNSHLKHKSQTIPSFFHFHLTLSLIDRAMGVLVFFMLSGYYPFDDESIPIMFRNIKKGR